MAAPSRRHGQLRANQSFNRVEFSSTTNLLTQSSPCEDYRTDGPDRYKTMTLDGPEFIRRFLMHVLPSGFHRIRHYGLFASAARACNIERIRALLAVADPSPQLQQPETDGGADHDTADGAHKCPCCGGRMIIVETFEGVRPSRPASPHRIRIDTS
jgi:hypothetical protein